MQRKGDLKKFVPFEKLSKRKKVEVSRKRRGDWGVLSPVTRVSKNPKVYDRKKQKKIET